MNSELTIENYQELPVSEQKVINGGVIFPILGGLALLIVEEVIRDWDNFKNGLTGQPEEN